VFLDNNLSPYLARGLNALLEPEGDEVVHLTDRFPRQIDDRSWINALGDEGGWVVISADRRIYRNRGSAGSVRSALRFRPAKGASGLRSRWLELFLAPVPGRFGLGYDTASVISAITRGRRR
jgi:hypothetical protein